METYSKLRDSIKRISKQKEQSYSILYRIILTIVLLPIVVGTLFIVIISFKKGYLEMAVIFLIFSLSVIYYFIWEFLSDIRIIILLRDLEEFNTFWHRNNIKIQNIEEILSGIESIHKKFCKLPVLNRYVLSKDSKYVFLQKTEIAYFMEILIDLRSDLSLRFTEQQSVLKGAKSEVEKTIGGTTGLEQVSEIQKLRLDNQIKQFEELQRVLVKA